MGDIMVVVEQRGGEIRDITFEILQKADSLANELGSKVIGVLLSDGQGSFSDEIVKWMDTLVTFEDGRLENYNSDLYVDLVANLILEYKPFLTLAGHTSWGLDYAPALSIRTGYPLATDVSNILLEEERPLVIRQIYSGKVFSKVSFKPSQGYLVTIRPGSFQPDLTTERNGEIVKTEIPQDTGEPRRNFKAFEDTAAGDVDITQADLLVSVGRGVGEPDNIPAVQELADLLGGTLSCSRPVVDKNWLPKYHQVGTSGKSVKPKVYLALGISGAFQHVAGITGAGCVIAVNKDKKAPIFRVADYGIVDDLFNVAAALKEQVKGA